MNTNRLFNRRTLITAAATPILALGLGLGLAPAQAQTSTAPTAATQPAPQLTIRDIYDHVVAAGYRDLREIELDDGRYEVKASDAQGQRVKLYVNARTGQVEHMKHEGARRR